ncbi:MAG: 60S ribosomal protein L31 [Thaumarchaeota archaeon]|nr:60S ribosomal protein L31 [Nitrososphaerota archaeon]
MSEKEEVERIYTVPLWRAWVTPRYRRTERVINLLKEFAARHMKSKEVKISEELNEMLWSRGIRNPPRRVTVKMVKDKDGLVTISQPAE